MKDNVIIREVGLRDGLQLSKSRLNTVQKLNWCKEQVDAGFKEIEVTSIVPKSILPQFSDYTDVYKGSEKITGLKPSVLVPNKYGGLKALEIGVKKITFVLSASEAHNKSNVKMSTKNSLQMLKELISTNNLKNYEDKAIISLAIATSFGCSIQGEVSEKLVINIIKNALAIGVDEINLADTVGYANPKQVFKLFSKVTNIFGNISLAAHFHDTRGMGLANVMAAYQAGVRLFDSSLGGLGGCPFAPGASGNISTEDCVYMLESIGVDTGINLQKLIKLRKKIELLMPDDIFYGKLVMSGISKIYKLKN